ncbi:MAG TPA: hypothetical protein VL527_02275 [Dongiaceae bacterium]|nr:hypothetical protein [Dongiaceae bacterium]
MTDHFTLLQEPRRPWLEPEPLREKFLTLSAQVHPDRVHNAAPAEKEAAQQRYTALNAAYTCLREPKDRLRHLLELELGAKPSDLTRIPDDLMAWFTEVGQLLRQTEAFRTEAAAVTSPLLKVQMFQRGQDWIEKLSALRQKIAGHRDALLAELKTLDAGWTAAKPLDRLREIWRLLGFYDRWIAQLQEREVQLSF